MTHILTDLIYEELEPFTRFEDQTNFALLKFIEAWAGSFLGDLYEIVRDTDDRVGWGVLFDPDEAPVEGLPYLSQFVGAVLTQDMDEEGRREEIKTPATWRRGGVEQLVTAIQRTLTGSKTVVVEERHTDNAWRMWVRTLEGETPYPAVTAAALMENKVIGIVPLYEAVTSIAWSDLVADYTHWSDVVSTFSTWQDVLLETP